MSGDYTSVEIRSQADAWQDALNMLRSQQETVRRLWREGGYDSLVYTGCGSTYYLALAAANLTQALTGVPSRGVPSSELLLHPDSIYSRASRPLLVAVSRSGETSETIQAARAYRQRFGRHAVVISCYDVRPLNAEAALTLVARKAQEHSIAQTRSFSSMLVVAEGMARVLAGLDSDLNLPGDPTAFVRDAEIFAESFADPERFDRYFYLGSGPLYGPACEAMLKMKEMSQTYAEAYHPLEFRHGPKSMVDERTMVIGLLGPRGYAEERAVLAEMGRLGASTLVLSGDADADFRLGVSNDREAPALACYLPPLQWMAYYRALKKSLDPDRPHNLDMVVIL